MTRIRTAAPFAAVSMILAIAAVASADSITIVSSKDNTLFESSTGSLSDGAGPHMYVGNNRSGNSRRAVIAFDVASAIPAGSVINSASLRLWMSQTSSGPTTITLNRLTRDWGEGTSNSGTPGGGGAPSTTGDATWIHTFYNTDFWSNPGGDFSPVISAGLTVSDVNYYTWSTGQMAADVQTWLDNPSTSFGWILRGNESASQTAKRFDTHETFDPNGAPMLTIDYTVPAPAGVAVLGLAGLGLAARRRRGR